MIHSAGPQSRAGSTFRSILKFYDEDGRTANLCENCDHYRPGMWWALWIKTKQTFFGGMLFTKAFCRRGLIAYKNFPTTLFIE